MTFFPNQFGRASGRSFKSALTALIDYGDRDHL